MIPVAGQTCLEQGIPTGMAGVRVSSTVPAAGLHRLADVLSPLFGIVHADCIQRAAENVLGRVHVRVRLMPALAAVEHRLAFTVLLVAVSAGVADA